LRGDAVPAGDIDVYPSNDTDLVVDIDGYFAPPGAGGLSLYTFPPCRVLDTRTVGNGQPFSGTLSPPVNVAGGPCAISWAQAYVFNATVVPQGPLGYLTLWPDGQPRPLAATFISARGSISTPWRASIRQTGARPRRRCRTLILPIRRP
jgi:hypothetical protein